MIKYKLIAWEFNAGLWASMVRDACDDLGVETLAGLMEVHQVTIRSWCKMKSGYEEFPYPNMTNCLKFCNHFDRDPRELFILSEV